MSIDRIAGQDAARGYIQTADAARAANAAAAVTVSDDARSLAAAREAVRKAPDTREEKVAAIKRQVESGTYQVAAHVLARKLMQQSCSRESES